MSQLSATLSRGLQAHWSFNNTDTENGIATDRSGFDRHGTISGGVTTSQPGVVGNAFEFDGTDGEITSSYKGVLGETARTTNLWFKSSISQNHWLVGWGTDNSSNKYTIRVESGQYLRTENAGGQIYDNDFPITDGNWHMLTVVFPDGGTNVQDHKLYVDATQSTNTGGGTQSLNTTAGIDVNIGGNPTGYQSQLDGLVDDIMIFDRELSASEIALLYNIRSPKYASI